MLISATSDRSRVSVLDPSLSKPLLRVDGVWLVGIPTADEFMEDFGPVKDSKEATTFRQEASAALSDNPNLPRTPQRRPTIKEPIDNQDQPLDVEDDEWGFQLRRSDIEGSEDYNLLPERIDNYREDDPLTGEYAKIIRYLQGVAPHILWRYRYDGIDRSDNYSNQWKVICVPWDQIEEAQWLFDRFLNGEDLSDYDSQEFEEKYGDTFFEDDEFLDPSLERAIAIAAENHAGQIDKAGAPYVLHPIRVMLKMDSGAERIVAVLHDVVEDTNVTFDDLRNEGFDGEVISAIDSVTRRNSESYEEFILRAAANPIGYKVKIADLIDNLDLNRIDIPTEKDFKRLLKYKNAIKILEKKSLKNNLHDLHRKRLEKMNNILP